MHRVQINDHDQIYLLNIKLMCAAQILPETNSLVSVSSVQMQERANLSYICQ